MRIVQSFTFTGRHLAKEPVRFHSQLNSLQERIRNYEILKNDHPLAPPTYLQNLKLKESTNPIPSLPDLTVTRVSSNPDIFIFRNLLTEHQLDHIIDFAKSRSMEYSGTKAGNRVNQRMNSYSCWIHQNQLTEGEVGLGGPAQAIAEYMTEISSIIFVSELLKDLSGNLEEDESNTILYDAEPLQVVKYEVGGKFDVHHDGFDRFLTILTYLNGVAGTWFPYAIINEDESMNMHESEIPDMRSPDIAKDKQPGRDGLLIISDNDESYEKEIDSHHIIRVRPGDAVDFFNYDWIVNLEEEKEGDIPPTGPLMNWRSIHSGLCTTEEKWIATNWFRMNKVE